MGRKPKGVAPENVYFGAIEEEYFLKYLIEDDKQRKDLIYNKYLKTPFEIMIDLVMKKYVNIPTGLETFDGVKEKMFSHLGYTINNYKPFILPIDNIIFSLNKIIINNLPKKIEEEKDFLIKEICLSKKLNDSEINSIKVNLEFDKETNLINIKPDNLFTAIVLYNEYTKDYNNFIIGNEYINKETNNNIWFENGEYVLTNFSKKRIPRKAYSYFSNVMKHYGWQIVRESQREKKEHISYNDVAPNLENDSKLSYQITNEQQEFFNLLFENIIKQINKQKNLNKNEELISNSLIEILKNREIIFDNLGETKKFDKAFIMTTLKEKTGLTTKEIHSGMNKFKNIYFKVKKSELNDD